MPKPIQRVKFKKAIARHTKIRDQNPSLGFICPGEPHERSTNAPKFEDRSQEETEWQELGAREAAWKLAENVFKLKEHERAAFFSSQGNRCLPASTFQLEEREFVVDSGASMHMISKKDLSDAEMDTLTKSCSPTIVINANGEVQTQEEAIVYVKELDIFLTMKVLENTPAVLSLGKLCDENGYSYKWINGRKPHLIKDGNRRVIPHHLLHPHLLHLQMAKFRFEKGKMRLTVTSLQCQCLIRLMIDQGNLMKKPRKPNSKNPLKRDHD